MNSIINNAVQNATREAAAWFLPEGATLYTFRIEATREGITYRVVVVGRDNARSWAMGETVATVAPPPDGFGPARRWATYAGERLAEALYIKGIEEDNNGR